MAFLFFADGKDSKEQGYCSSPGFAEGRYICPFTFSMGGCYEYLYSFTISFLYLKTYIYLLFSLCGKLSREARLFRSFAIDKAIIGVLGKYMVIEVIYTG